MRRPGGQSGAPRVQHRIGVAHIRAAMIDAGVPVEVPGTDQLEYVGTDDRGMVLHIIAVPDDREPDGLVVIHCIPQAMRRKP